MRVLIASDTFPPDVNGAARFTERLGQGLVARGHEVHQVAPATHRADGVENVGGVTVHRLASVQYPGLDYFRYVLPWHAWPQLRRIIDEIRPDVIHVQNHFVLGRAAISIAHRQGIPLVATNHFMPENLTDHARVPAPMRRFASRVAWRDLHHVYGKADSLTAPTPRAVGLLETSADLPGAEAISCGIDSNLYWLATQTSPPHDVPEILFVGRLDQEKRVDELLRAVALLPSSLAFTVKVIGDGAHRKDWERLAASLGLVPSRVTFTGFIPEKDLVAAYGGCDIFCMPGVAELQSLVTLEAMSAGKPVVAADAMALPHLVHPGRNGWLFTPGNVPELSAHLEALLRDAKERERMGHESREIVAAHDLSKTLDRFEAIYAEVMA